MRDQAYNLRQMSSSSNPAVITVTSGKGGVGKSNFTVNLAVALSKLNKKVLIFDADIGMGNDDILLGCVSKNNIYDLIKDDTEIEDILINGPQGVKLLPGGSGLNKIEDLSDNDRNSILSKIGNLKGLDYILIDTGGGISRDILSFTAFCEILLVVITTEPTSLTDAYSLLKAITHFNLKNTANIIVNKSSNEKEGESSFNKLNKAAKYFLKMNLNYFGMVSEDAHVSDSVKKQIPFILEYPNSTASRDISKIAMKITGENEDLNNKLGFDNFIKKIFSVFS